MQGIGKTDSGTARPAGGIYSVANVKNGLRNSEQILLKCVSGYGGSIAEGTYGDVSP
jgi:hypothetical protein